MALRSMRFSASLPDSFRPPFKTIYKVAMHHNFYLSILPARTGELYYVKILSSNLEVPKKYSILSLFTCRLYDVVIVCGLGLYSLCIPFGIQDPIVPILLLIAVFGVIALLMFLRQFIDILRRLAISCTCRLHSSIQERVAKFTNFEIPNLGHLSRSGQEKLFLTTVLVFTSLAFNYWLILHMFGTNLDLVDLVFVVAIVNLTNLVPVQTIGGFGLRESALIFALISIGMEANTATALGVISRLILFLVPVLVSALFLATRIDKEL